MANHLLNEINIVVHKNPDGRKVHVGDQYITDALTKFREGYFN